MVRIASARSFGQSSNATLVIHDQRIPLKDDADLEGLIDEILQGIRAGGGVVHVENCHGREYDVIVTPTSQALICHAVDEVDDHSGDGAWISIIDLDC